MNEIYLQQVLTKIEERLKKEPKVVGRSISIEINLNEYISIPRYDENRDEKSRIHKVLPALKADVANKVSSLYLIDVMYFLSDVRTHKEGTICLGNGHTRRECAKQYPELFPSVIKVNVHFIEDEIHAETTFSTWNHRRTAMTSGEEYTRLFNKLDFEPKSKFGQSGNFSTLFGEACKYYIDKETRMQRFKRPTRDAWGRRKGREERMSEFLEELKLVDRIFSSELFPKQHKNAAFAIPIMMVAKKYGVNHPRVKLLEEYLSKNITELDISVGNNYVDGITYLMKHYIPNQQNWNVLKFSNNEIVSPQMAKFLELFVLNTTINIRKPGLLSSSRTANKYRTGFYF